MDSKIVNINFKKENKNQNVSSNNAYSLICGNETFNKDVYVEDLKGNKKLIRKFDNSESDTFRAIATDGVYVYLYLYIENTDEEKILKVEINDTNNVIEIKNNNLLKAHQTMFDNLGLCGSIVDNKLFFINCDEGEKLTSINLETLKYTDCGKYLSDLYVSTDGKLIF